MLESFIYFKAQMSPVNGSDIKIGNVHNKYFPEKAPTFM